MSIAHEVGVIARTTSTIAMIGMLAACGGRTVVVTPPTPVSSAQLAQLWVDPRGTPRDLFWGIGGKRYAPAPDAVYALKAKDETGFSVSFDVVGPGGIEWSAKIGEEAQVEVVLSRILWGLGYHQPPVYYLPSWRLGSDATGFAIQSEARFRPKLPQLDRQPAPWSWADNPVSGTRELKGLLVILLMLNSTDLKDSNNTVYESNPSWDGASRWLVVRDLGAALGETGKLYPRRNWLDGFEQQSFITGITAAGVEFDYDGRHKELLDMVAPVDVRWAAARMARLSEEQWRDAFRAGNYAPSRAERYIRRIKEKIADGLALRVDQREAT
jgi:hypothetical protein